MVSDHSFKRFKLSCNVTISCTVFTTLYSFTSSAYNLHVVLPLRVVVTSLTYSKKSSGPKQLPCTIALFK